MSIEFPKYQPGGELFGVTSGNKKPGFGPAIIKKIVMKNVPGIGVNFALGAIDEDIARCKGHRDFWIGQRDRQEDAGKFIDLWDNRVTALTIVRDQLFTAWLDAA